MAYNARKSRGNSFRKKNSAPKRFFGARSQWNIQGNSRNKFSKKTQITDKSLYVNDLHEQAVEEKSSYNGHSFDKFDLHHILKNNLKSKGFETTTEIQERAIPLAMNGSDVLGISATGSGKTGAFLLPMIQKLLSQNSQRLLIVAPTRELALQISKEAISLIKGTYLRASLVVGGESMYRQISELKRGGHIVVSTPGRLNDHIKRGTFKPEIYNNIVIDEVDRMLDMGFVNDIRQIFSQISSEKQSLFFSATLNNTVEGIVSSFTKKYELIRLAGNTASKSVVQSVINYTDADQKLQLLEDLLRKQEVSKAIVFVDTKRFADKVNKELFRKNFKVDAIHGDKRQNVRKRVIDKFKNSQVTVLVATNVAARGIDIDDISHVINLDEPQTYDEYIHRIGRTGRNGSYGNAVTFVRK